MKEEIIKIIKDLLEKNRLAYLEASVDEFVNEFLYELESKLEELPEVEELKENEQLEQQIEKMKCCNNCKLYQCEKWKNNEISYHLSKCENWELAE